jgi:hypothetical protein
MGVRDFLLVMRTEDCLLASFRAALGLSGHEQLRRRGITPHRNARDIGAKRLFQGKNSLIPFLCVPSLEFAHKSENDKLMFAGFLRFDVPPTHRMTSSENGLFDNEAAKLN